MSLSRRKFLEIATALGLVSCDRGHASNATTTPGLPPPTARFEHGVASGDPQSDRVILWTRVSGVDTPVDVAWTIARDAALNDVVATGTAVATRDADFTVKVDATGLEPGSTYHYGFEVGAQTSPVGRTRTLPQQTERVRFALASCSNYAWGFFNGYAAIAQHDDLDAVLHLGDYIYEHANGTYGDGIETGRVPDPDKELLTLEDYRRRYAQYRTDPDLQAAHRRHPFIPIWDDHESANNAHRQGAENHQPDEGDWAERRAAAIKAYFEWLPIRETEDGKIWRSFRYGELLDLFMLDTRLWGRDPQIEDRTSPALADDARTLLGKDQEAWLTSSLAQSTSEGVAWRALGQQVLMGHIRNDEGKPWNTDMWSGYDPARQRLLAAMAKSRDVVVFTGDVHSSWAMELTPNPFDAKTYDPDTGAGSVGVEIVTPAISSPPPVKAESADAAQSELTASHPHIRWLDLKRRGYVVVDVDAERVQAQWFHLETVETRSTEQRMAHAMVTRRGRSRMESL